MILHPQTQNEDLLLVKADGICKPNKLLGFDELTENYHTFWNQGLEIGIADPRSMYGTNSSKTSS
jgi:hypothetical protein